MVVRKPTLANPPVRSQTAVIEKQQQQKTKTKQNKIKQKEKEENPLPFTILIATLVTSDLNGRFFAIPLAT